jgi:UDP-N-acetylmuramate dehydrogenase
VWQFDTSPCHRVVISAIPAFRSAVETLEITVVANEPLARHTTFHIGGPADLYAAVSNIDQLERLTQTAATHDIPITILGGGSNILVSDAGVCGLVIANQARDFGLSDSGLPIADLGLMYAVPKSEIGNPQLVAASGVALAGLARWAVKNGWTGLEWAVSVPGTVGGAVIGNAGAHGGDIAGNLIWALVAYPGQGRRLLAKDDMQFAYRSSILKRQIAAGESLAVLAAGFQLQPSDVAEMTARADGYLAKRRASQPVEPSAGSIFRNPPGDHAGRLIEAAGLKGYRIGGAQISPRHANFIVNVENARADDVIALIDLMRNRVFEQFGVELIPEILFVGDWPKQPPYSPLPPE